MAESGASGLFDRVVDADGVLLRIEALHPDGMSAAAMLLTFDVGRILLCVRPESPGLTALALEKPEEVPGRLVDAGQEEPWWRVLGNALRGVEPQGSEGLRFQFRRIEENPRFIVISALGAGLYVEMEPI